MNWQRWILILVVTAAVAGAVAWGFMPRALLIDTATVQRGPLKVTVEEEARTRVVDRFVVSAPVSGYMRRIKLDAGDAVKAGSVVAEIEPRRSEALDPRSRAEAAARVDAAKAALRAANENARAAKADSSLAASELKRIKGLFDDGYTTQERLDRARADERRTKAALKSAEFGVEVARHELEAARTALKIFDVDLKDEAARTTLKITSPVGGSVLKLLRESEGTVAAGEPLIEVGDPGALEVVSEVLSTDAVRIKPGGRVVFDRWGGDEPLEGRVRTVEPAGFTKVSALGVEEQRVYVISDITSPRDQWTRLGDGYRVDASFILWEGTDVLKVPSSALFRFKGGWAVFTVEGGRAVRRPVETGRRGGLFVEITKGLKPGETVITHPDDKIDDGVKVKTR